MNDESKEESNYNNSTTIDIDKLTLTVEEAAKIIGVGKKRMLEITKQEDFPAIRFKGKIIINKTQFVEWFNKLTLEGLVKVS